MDFPRIDYHHLASGMFQVNFSEQSMAELNKLDVLQQMQLVEQISNLTPEQLASAKEPLGRFNREGQTFYRLRAGDFRCYFEVNGDQLSVNYLLHKNTLTDFIFRTKLPITEEQMAEQHSSFWKYLESLKKSKTSD